MIPCECCCDDKKVRDLEKKVNKAVYSVAVNGEIIYPTDGVGNVNLGDIGGSTDARDIKMPDGTSVAVNIDDLNTAVKDAVSEVVPTPVTDGINLNETDGNGTVSRMLIRADDTLKFDGLNVGISEATDARITQAQADATTAGTKADDAQADADDAMTAANTAKATADTALTKAETGIENAGTAQATADDALTKANASITGITRGKTVTPGTKTQYWLKNTKNDGSTSETPLFSVSADDFNIPGGYDEDYEKLAISDTLKAKINGAISAIGASVVDTALEMNIDKADGSTATEQLFSIGDGLEWVEGVLKATASSAGHTVTYTDYIQNFNFVDWLTNASNGLHILSGIPGYGGYLPTKVYTPTAATITATAYGYKLNVTSTFSNAYANNPIFIFKTDNSILLFSYAPFAEAATRSIPLTVDDSTTTVSMKYTINGINYINDIVDIDDISTIISLGTNVTTIFEYEGLSSCTYLSRSDSAKIPSSYIRVISIT